MDSMFVTRLFTWQLSQDRRLAELDFAAVLSRQGYASLHAEVKALRLEVALLRVKK